MKNDNIYTRGLLSVSSFSHNAVDSVPYVQTRCLANVYSFPYLHFNKASNTIRLCQKILQVE